MNRRAFLTGLFGAAAVASLGPLTALEKTKGFDNAAWEAAILGVYSDHFTSLVLYGTAALRYDDEFPFVHNVVIEELYPLPPTTGGLL